MVRWRRALQWILLLDQGMYYSLLSLRAPRSAGVDSYLALRGLCAPNNCRGVSILILALVVLIVYRTMLSYRGCLCYTRAPCAMLDSRNGGIHMRNLRCSRHLQGFVRPPLAVHRCAAQSYIDIDQPIAAAGSCWLARTGIRRQSSPFN